MTIQQAFDLAVEHHNAGRLGEAEGLYRQIVAHQPGHADAMHMLGVIALQVGKNDAAVEWISRAIAINRSFAHYHNNLGLALTQLGRFEEAVGVLRTAVQLQPDLPDAQNNLGNALRRLGRYDEAISAFRYAIGFNPKMAEAHSNLGSTFRSLGRFTEAESEYRTAIQFNPNLPQAYNGLGSILASQNQLDAAIEMFRAALRIDPRWAEVQHNLGNLLRERGRNDEAIAAYQKAIALKPELSESHNNLGIAYRNLGRNDEAIASFHRAIQLNPNQAGSYSNMGNALKEMNRVDEAIAAYESAIKLDPEMFEAYTNLGNTLKDSGDVEASIALQRRAISLGWQFTKLHSNLLYSLYFHPGYTQKMIHAEELVWAERHAAPLKPLIKPLTNDRDPERPLRIGFVSPDFREHCQAFFTVPLLKNLDKQQFHITCYSSVFRPDSVTTELEWHTHQWRDIVGVDDANVAQQIRNDQIDILIDLTLHMAGNRLLVFAHKPAPVQVTWLGYPGSTGLDTIDYRLTDPYLDPPGTDESVYTEQSYRLPDTFWCFDPLTTEPKVNPLPADTNGFITFGCLNNFSKVNRGVLELWAQLLQAVPTSRMVILADPSRQRQKTLDTLKELGVDSARIRFEDKRPRIGYLELYQQVDITLDTFPYNGHTTSLDSLWMGVPIVSLVGGHPVARAGLTLLSNVGLAELAVREADAYVNQAVALANDRLRLAELRKSLRATTEASPLMDSKRFARNFETALREMWRKWCAG